jgi:hypothetical protein
MGFITFGSPVRYRCTTSSVTFSRLAHTIQFCSRVPKIGVLLRDLLFPTEREGKDDASSW